MKIAAEQAEKIADGRTPASELMARANKEMLEGWDRIVAEGGG
jgi:hypothetical protein